MPPSLPRKFLRWFCDPELLEDVEGDLQELYQQRLEELPSRARLLYFRDVLLLFRPGIIRAMTINSSNSPTMIQHYLKTTIRHALRYRGYTALNLLGLTVGLTASILIVLWVRDELKMDQFHANSDRIYQVWRNMHQGSGEVITTSSIPQPMELVLKDEYPEVEDITLLWNMSLLFRTGEEFSYETGHFASPEFFRIFSFPLLVGNPATALENPRGVVISERLAHKFFGPDWPSRVLDETFRIEATREYAVTGVFKDPGTNSSLQFDWVLPAQAYVQENEWVQSWFNGSFEIYFTLREGADIHAVKDRAVQEINKHTDHAADERIYLQQFSDHYLHSTFKNGVPSDGRIQYVQVLSLAAIFILIIACVNFMNLATARSSRRAKEIGLRKVLGSPKGSLSLQFFSESFLLAFVAVLLALLAVWLLLPLFNNITGKALTLELTDPQLWLGIGVITLITGFFSGSYPALLLPSFPVVSSLKGVIKHSPASRAFRSGLVTFQFALSMLLIIGTLVISQQIHYILNKNLGLDKENLVFVDFTGELYGNGETYKTQLQTIPEVKSVTLTSGNPLNYGRSSGSAEWDGKDPNYEVEMNVLNVDTDFFPTMGVEISQGRTFSEELSTDTANYIINEVTADILGFEDPVGQDFSVWDRPGKIIGVVRNFHMSSLYEPIGPLVIRYDPANTNTAFIRTQQDIPAALQGIERVTKQLNPDFSFRYHFLDQTYADTYRSEMTLGTLIRIFAVVSIIVACLGLLGLSSYSADQRSKEISIRKVHGARVGQLILMLGRKYALLMVLAFVIAAPVAYYFVQQWLNSFVFHIDLQVLVFLTAGLLAFVIGVLTVSVKSYQAAAMNPVQKLKSE